MSWILVFLVFILGMAVGSFVNVLIDRTAIGQDWVWGRSRCDYCDKQLSWYDNIPLFSFLIYRGRTRCCKKNLAWKHPFIEVLFGLLFAWWLLIGFFFFGLVAAPWIIIQPAYWLITGILLLVIAIADYYYGVILMPFVYLGIVITMLYRFGVYQLTDWWLMLVSGILSFGFLWFLRFITRGKGMGDGDPYLAFLTGIILAWERALEGMLLAFISGALYGVGLLIIKKSDWKETVPFGPFLILGVIGSLLLTHYGVL